MLETSDYILIPKELKTITASNYDSNYIWNSQGEFKYNDNLDFNKDYTFIINNHNLYSNKNINIEKKSNDIEQFFLPIIN